MSKNFFSLKLSEIADVVAGQSPESIYYSNNEGVPFLQGNRTFGTLYPSIDTYTLKVTKLAKKDEVLMSVRAPVGDLNFAPCDLCIGRGLASIKAKNGNNKFVYYALKYNINNLLRQGNGTTFDSVNKDVINDFELIIPENKTARDNATKVLSALDDKIELNNRINAELEQMAKTLYDYWFVQFDFPCLPENYKFSGAGKPENFESVLTYRQVGGMPAPDGKKWFIYVILCDDGSFYKGITNDLYRRYYEHVTGQGADWTKAHKPRKIIHYEVFESQEKAAEREKELKTGFGRTWLDREYKKHLEDEQLSKIGGLPAPKTKLRPAGKMVWNAELKREIPEGWEGGTLGDINSLRLIRI